MFQRSPPFHPPPRATLRQQRRPLRLPPPRPTANSVSTQTNTPTPTPTTTSRSIHSKSTTRLTYAETPTNTPPSFRCPPWRTQTGAASSSPPPSASLEDSPYEDLSEYEKEMPLGNWEKWKGKAQRASQPPYRPPRPPPIPPPLPQFPQFAVVLHAVPTKYKLVEVRRWLEEDNQHLHIAGSRWLLADNRPAGKSHSSVGLYLQGPTIATSLRLGRKSLRTTTYAWDR